MNRMMLDRTSEEEEVTKEVLPIEVATKETTITTTMVSTKINSNSNSSSEEEEVKILEETEADTTKRAEAVTKIINQTIAIIKKVIRK